MTPTTHFRSRYDVVIVGARAAGAATALLLARSGLSVLAIDRSAYGSDTLSTLALMRGGVLQLQRWGVLEAIRASGTPPVRRTVFRYADEIVEVPIKPRDGVEALYAPRRTVLDRLLVDEARAAGAHIVHGVRLAGLPRSIDGRVRGIAVEDRSGTVTRISAGLVVGADGQRSTVARLVGAADTLAGRHTGGVVYGYWSGLAIDGYHWYFRPRVTAGAIPTTGGVTLLFAGVPADRFMREIRLDIEAGYHRIIREVSPALAEAVRGGRREEKLWGFAGQTGYFRQSWGPGWALVGDAGYFKDPITAHGITDALRDADLLSRAILQGTERALADYQATRNQLSLGVFKVTDDIASFQWDLEMLKEQHQTLSREMAAEVTWLAALDGEPAMVAG